MLMLFSLACLFATDLCAWKSGHISGAAIQWLTIPSISNSTLKCSVHVSYGQVGCPGDARVRVMDCIRPLRAYLQEGPPKKKDLCGLFRDGVQCARDVVSECEGSTENSPLQQMVQGFEVIEGDINSTCSKKTSPEPSVTEGPPAVTEPLNEISVCGKKERRTLLRCSRKLQRFAAETPIRCERVRRAMDCMNTLLEKCRSNIRRKTIAKVESLREDLMSLCVETTDEIDDNIIIPVSIHGESACDWH